MKNNAEAELTILKYLCTHYNLSYLSIINPEWFYSQEYESIFIVLKEMNRKVTPVELSDKIADKFPSMYFNSMRDELFRENNIDDEEVMMCVDIIEEKYKLRQLDRKLVEIRDKIYNETISDIQTELISYFHNNVSVKEEIKTLDEDFELVNADLINFGESRPALNKLVPLKDTVITIGGESSHHKTNQLIDILVRGLMHNYKTNPKFKVMLFSGEMSWKRIRDRIFSKMLHIELSKITRREIDVKKTVDEFKEKYPQLISNFILVSPKQFRTVSDLSKLVIQQKPDIWGLDFLQYFAQMSAGNKAEMQNKNVMEAIATIKVLVEVTNSLAIVLSQLRKKSEQRLIHFPRMEDLEWSGLTRQISDIIGMCFWPYKINPTAQINWYTVSWQKTRDTDSFNEVLWVDPAFCDFKPHPTPNIERKYFDW